MHNPQMTTRVPFTKMHGAGNDFIVFDARGGLPDSLLAPEQIRRLSDRRFGIGADQILLVEKSPDDQADFVYRIFNADGQEVEQCGNGARCFARYVVDRGLISGPAIRVSTKAGLIHPVVEANGEVTVDMGSPQLTPQSLPFLVEGLPTQQAGNQSLYELSAPQDQPRWFGPVSMGNPHLVTWVENVQNAPVGGVGLWLQTHDRLPNRVNVGFGQIHSPTSITLRVFERGAGETLACGTGACAAVVSGVAQGLLAAGQGVCVQTAGGMLTIRWSGTLADSVWMTGPATTVYEGEIWV
jgi:diaminopimelate epimerase